MVASQLVGELTLADLPELSFLMQNSSFLMQNSSFLMQKECADLAALGVRRPDLQENQENTTENRLKNH